MAASLVFIAYDDERGPALFKVDPSGFVAGHRGTSDGVKSQVVISELEKYFKRTLNLFLMRNLLN